MRTLTTCLWSIVSYYGVLHRSGLIMQDDARDEAYEKGCLFLTCYQYVAGENLRLNKASCLRQVPPSRLGCGLKTSWMFAGMSWEASRGFVGGNLQASWGLSWGFFRGFVLACWGASWDLLGLPGGLLWPPGVLHGLCRGLYRVLQGLCRVFAESLHEGLCKIIAISLQGDLQSRKRAARRGGPCQTALDILPRLNVPRHDGGCLYKVKPKLHYFCHVVDNHLVTAINPRWLHNFQDEDFNGRIARLCGKVHVASVMVRAFQRYLLFLGMRFEAMRRAQGMVS